MSFIRTLLPSYTAAYVLASVPSDSLYCSTTATVVAISLLRHLLTLLLMYWPVRLLTVSTAVLQQQQ